MSNAYKWQFTWLKCTRTADGTTGDKPRTYADNGPLWGSYEAQSANEVSEYGAARQSVQAVIKIRNFPSISTLDRLLLQRDNLTFVIDGVRKDWEGNQLVIDAHSLTGGAV